MPSVKISELPVLNELSANNANTVFVAVDKTTNTTSQFSTTTLAAGLFANNILNVGTESASDFTGLIAQFVANSSPYGQVNFENSNTESSMDIVITADIGDDANNFLDLGMNNSGYNDPQFSSMRGADGYLFVNGSQGNDYVGNLVIGTTATETNVVFSVGGTTNLDVVAKMTKNGLMFDNSGYITFDDGSTQITGSSPASVTLSTQANTIITQGVDATQNTRLNSIESVNANQNTSINIIQGVDLTQNTNITAINNYAQSGYAKANAALANTTGTFAGDLTITGGLIVANTINGSNVSIANQIQFTSNARIRTASGTGNEKDIVILSGDELTLNNGGSISIQTGAGTLTGRGGDINLTAGLGGLGRGIVNVTGNRLNVTGNISASGDGTFVGNLDINGTLKANGIITLNNSSFASNTSFLSIVASDDFTVVPPSNTNYMIHVTGKANSVTRVVLDSFGANTYPLVAGRMGRGSSSNPQPTQNNDVMMRIVGNGYTPSGFKSSSPAKIDFVAHENFTNANTGTRIEFWNTPVGSNTIQEIASFNADSADFLGVVNPQKGMVFTPRVFPAAQTAITLDFSSDVIVRSTLTADLAITLTNYRFGKIVEVWLTNTTANPRTITHGCIETNSTTNSTTFTMGATSSAYLRYFSIDGDNANTFVAVQYA